MTDASATVGGGGAPEQDSERASAPGAALEVRDLSWHVGGAKIVRGVTFAVTPGEFVGVIGPNGAGKTSLFNLISGINPITSGEVLLGGRA
ncbi:MAG: ATP-binding cassette domain-containing protein, partial [Propionibacteriaceae bacterium]|nr:ATP-binding cassette domain-containing protein [Propionibacteriaceae bacterium]